jgi:hypothetical protein
MSPELDEQGALLNALLETEVAMRDNVVRFTAELHEQFAGAMVELERLIALVDDKVHRASTES